MGKETDILEVRKSGWICIILIIVNGRNVNKNIHIYVHSLEIQKSCQNTIISYAIKINDIMKKHFFYERKKETTIPSDP